LSGAECRTEHFLQIREKDFAVRRDFTFIEKDKAVGSDAGNLFSPRSPFRLALDRILLSGVQAFFPCGSPSPKALRSAAEY